MDFEETGKMTQIDISKCKITHYPAKVIKSKAKPIEEINENTRQLVEKMTDIMIENRGMGLAGPQAGVDLQIFIISIGAARENVRAYINPTVTPEGSLCSEHEGCLSVPGVSAGIKRYSRCTVTATDLDGKTFTEEADGLYARCLQHEYDHLQGMTIADRMGSASKIRFRKQIKKLVEEQQNCEKD